ncbi:MAG: 16S rRNA processing protein RimM [Clostridia bacterium]|nr:16S rRNA processing protein RimM [Clostridia bacterium]
MEKYLEAGKIVNTHGVKGDLKVECRCDDQEVFASLSTLYLKKSGEYVAYRCTKNQPMKHMMLVHLESVDTMEEAILLKNRSLYADREDFDLPEGSYFIADLIGTPVYDEHTGECYGKLTDVNNHGAGDIYEITRPDGTKALVPAVPAFVSRTLPGEGIYLTPIEGLI